MYEAFSVISGIILLACVAVPGLSVTDRAWTGLGGAFLLVYGIYVSTRTTGTFTFPAVIFVIPFAAVGYVVYKVMAGSPAGGAQDRGVAPPRPGVATQRAVGPGERTPEQIAALTGTPAVNPLRGSVGASECVRVGCPRRGWVVREPRCHACGHPTSSTASSS